LILQQISLKKKQKTSLKTILNLFIWANFDDFYKSLVFNEAREYKPLDGDELKDYRIKDYRIIEKNIE
jgi:hypothetical protein